MQSVIHHMKSSSSYAYKRSDSAGWWATSVLMTLAGVFHIKAGQMYSPLAHLSQQSLQTRWVGNSPGDSFSAPPWKEALCFGRKNYISDRMARSAVSEVCADRWSDQ